MEPPLELLTILRTTAYKVCTNIYYNVSYYWYQNFNAFVLEPKKLCEFRPINGKILKTVDSVYQNVKTVEECKEKCLNSPYRCHSFDFGDPSNSVCRTSHLDKNSLSHIEDPYLEISGATTHELLSCYNG
jgi:hypothetical protein